MPNHYFQFKEFRVEQEHCAMKVCTDACIQGAYAAERMHGVFAGRNMRILDIGTGTGLLSLMLAQKLPAAHIDAIELDAAAYRQACGNFAASPWKDRLHLFNGDARTLVLPEKYHFIISNPPFFNNDLKGADHLRNQARHTLHLDDESLIRIVRQSLHKDGKFCIMLPFARYSHFCKVAESHSFYPEESLHIRQTPQHDLFRTIGIFSATWKQANERELCIKNAGNEYSDEFVSLLKDYYLCL